ncbi:hypothetical protein A8F94_04365 [Bacillus sp. FJAT-27225]|uniref:shikimate kinase n=1 Tax=Bacillus sp. FJAT-27225 TaxID=1743144 RepID=UPI00080C21E3|nr:shikimate kinase [Bacillus sp. FJAT-27225]OCA91100.1 hypothetical protein A8F94_04365 [Bacillus sp. FJAT-27225]
MKTIFLIGFMGSGKSTVGKILAEKLGIRFVDMDEEIERTARKSISAIFQEEGEESFRDLETALLTSFPGSELVVATGGGAVLREVNRGLLKQSGLVIYLKASAEEISKRLVEDETRPLLKGDKKKEIAKRLNNRLPLYTAISDLTVMTDEKSPETIAEEIAARLKEA